MAYCTCLDWVENIEKVIVDTMTAQARNPHTHPGYTGKVFTHCPWCGSPLNKYDSRNINQSPLLDT